jgi:hypothetical protein
MKKISRSVNYREISVSNSHTIFPVFSVSRNLIQNWSCYAAYAYGVHIDTFLVGIFKLLGDIEKY